MSDAVEKPARRRFTNSLEVAELEIAAIKLRRPLKVFLAGPYIERGWTAEQRLEKSNPALLRVELTNYIENELRHEVTFGEHRGVVEISDEKLRSRSSPVIIELHLVKTTCDAIVVLPSSPGSYSELGLWSIYDDVCRKMLILADKNYENEGGYLNTGVFRTATHHGATLKWINYLDVNFAQLLVKEYISEIEDRAIVSEIKKNG